jgi:hypothetical protein
MPNLEGLWDIKRHSILPILVHPRHEVIGSGAEKHVVMTLSAGRAGHSIVESPERLTVRLTPNDVAYLVHYFGTVASAVGLEAVNKK